jgi:hypothetical protein
MYKKKIQAGQTIYDFALQEYGCIEGVLLLMEDNRDLVPDLNADPKPGSEFLLRESDPIIDTVVRDFYRKEKTNPSGSYYPDAETGIGSMIIESTFIVE